MSTVPQPAESAQVKVERDGPILRVVISNPGRLNALTMSMYDEIGRACDAATSTSATAHPVRLLLLSGDGGIFSAGTDIRTFLEFGAGSHGLAYERRVAAVCDRLAGLAIPTVAMIRGHCLGGGMLLAAACDIRVACDSATFGIPYARTIGNCLSARSLDLVSSRIGASVTDDLILRARILSADDAAGAGFLHEVCPAAELDQRTADVVSTLLSRSQISQWALKELRRREREHRLGYADDDVIARVYGGAEFPAAVRAFLSKEPPPWTVDGTTTRAGKA